MTERTVLTDLASHITTRGGKWMKRLRRFKPVLLVIAAAVAGCGAQPVMQPSQAIAPTMKAMSCTERSASARAPKNPIVELAWCIAETDDLYDPDQLFKGTLALKHYSISEGITWGIQAGTGGSSDFQNLPKGVIGFLFQRKDPKELNEVGSRRLGFGIDPHNLCVTQEDIFATFGRDYWISQAPIKSPGAASSGSASARTGKAITNYGIFYKSPHLFKGDPSGTVYFDFDFYECANYVRIQRDLDFIIHHQRESHK